MYEGIGQYPQLAHVIGDQLYIIIFSFALALALL